MKRRTTILLDQDLLHEAEKEFGTQGPTDTVHTALREALAFRARLRLATHDFPGLTPEFLEATRTDRDFVSLVPTNSARRHPKHKDAAAARI